MPFIEITEYHLKKMQIERLGNEGNDLFGYIAQAKKILEECGKLPLKTEAIKIKTLWQKLDEIMLLAQITNIVARWRDLTQIGADTGDRQDTAIHELTEICLKSCHDGDYNAAYIGFEELRNILIKQKNFYDIQAQMTARTFTKQNNDRTKQWQSATCGLEP